MKNKVLIIFLFSILGLTYSCTPEEIEMNDISDVFITWSPLSIHANDSVSLGDGSRGELWRQWTFPGGGVCKIIGSNELTSTERIVHAIFYSPGLFDVRLQAEFNDPSLQLDSLITITVLPNGASKFTPNNLGESATNGMDLGQYLKTNAVPRN
jgi:hypothetical protein